MVKQRPFCSRLPWLIFVIVGILVFVGILYAERSARITGTMTRADEFDADRAYAHVINQVELGPRYPGSNAHNQVQHYIRDQLVPYGWQIETQKGISNDHAISNIIAKRGSGFPWIILGAHYDSRLIADHDPDENNRSLPVPGANDGASGVAVLLELGRALPETSGKTIWLVFFDAEDQGRIPGWDWILGSSLFTDSLTTFPDAVVVIDMIGDSDLNIYYEINSDPTIRSHIWATAESLGYGAYFIPEEKYSMLDDHTPFLDKGIPAIDIIDFDYPYWHTVQDTEDKVSPISLKAVGDTLIAWLTTP
ncbi:MAG: M28 family peptidase [Anaerolineae bacterium]|jgi:hypothetical protein|nr:M28 family peptidase [Anaerolineae bacterium]